MEVAVNGIKIYYEVLGEGKPIILLNPNSTDTNAMKFIAKKLSKNYMVYIFHRRCCGKSEKNCKLTYEDSAKDVYEFIKKLDIHKPYLLGSSGGATVALNVAINYPTCIAKLICCSGVSKNGIVAKPLYAKILEKIPYYPGKKENEMFEKLNNTIHALEPSDLNKIVVPTLVVNGGKKDIVPVKEAEYICQNIKESELLILEKEGHFSYMINCRWLDKLNVFLEK